MIYILAIAMNGYLESNDLRPESPHMDGGVTEVLCKIIQARKNESYFCPTLWRHTLPCRHS